MAPFLRASWRPNSFLEKLNSVAGGVPSPTRVEKPSEVLFRPRKADVESAAASTATPTKADEGAPSAVTSEATTTTSVKSDSNATPTTPTKASPPASSATSSIQKPAATKNTSVVVPPSSTETSPEPEPTASTSSGIDVLTGTVSDLLNGTVSDLLSDLPNVPIPTTSSTGKPTTTTPPSATSTKVPNGPAPSSSDVPSPAPSSGTPTIVVPSPPATPSPSPSKVDPRPGNGSSSVVLPVPNPSPAPSASQPPLVTQVPDPVPTVSPSPTSVPANPTTAVVGRPVVNPPVVSSSVVDGTNPSQDQVGQATQTALPSFVTVVLPSGSSASAPALTASPSDATLFGAQGSDVDGTTFTESSVTRVLTTTSESVVTSGGRTFTTGITVESTQVLPTLIPVPTSGSSALSDSNPQKTKALIGGITGGAIIVLAIALLAWILARRRRRRQEFEFLEAATFDHYSPAPLRSNVSSFVAPPPPSIRARSLSPAMTAVTSESGFVVTSARKKPPPFLEDPTLQDQNGADPFDVQSFETTSSFSLNPVHVHPMSIDDPIKPMSNPFDDPVGPEPSSSKRELGSSSEAPALVVSPATPTAAESRFPHGSSVKSKTKPVSYGVAV